MYQYMMKLDICFVLDCTSSMSPWITVLHQQTPGLWKMLESQGAKLIRIAFIGYRDVDDNLRFERWNFPSSGASTPPEAWSSFLASIKAGGGDDKAEDVLGGLQEALSLSWCADHLKLLIHVADGPSHGLYYHSIELEDLYTGFDFDGNIGKKIFESLIDRGIDYCFLDASTAPSCNTKMLERFTGWYKAKAKGSQRVMKVVPSATPQQLIDVVRDEVARILRRDIVTSSNYFQKHSKSVFGSADLGF